MKVSPVGSNMTEVQLNDGTKILFSYKTPVAANLYNGGYVRTSTYFSKTTSRHINKWLEGVKADLVEQSFLEQLA